MLFEQAPAAMWIQKGRIVVEANSRAHELFGSFDNNGFVGSDITGYLRGDSSGSIDIGSEALELFSSVEAGIDASAEWKITRLDGVPCEIHVDMGRMVYADELLIKVVAWDVTAVNLNQRQLAAARYHLEEFIANFSHELRTALFNITGFSNILRRNQDTRNTGQMNEFLAILNIETLKISSLIEEVLSISRITSGNSHLKRWPVDLGSILRKIVSLMESKASRKGVALRLQHTGDESMVCVDSESINRAIVNMVDNALKATPEGGSVVLELNNDARRAVATLQVKDSGIGIPADSIPFVFDPFFRVQRPERQEDGYGLGLTIAKKIIEAHGGSITVASEEGCGTAVTVELTLCEGNVLFSPE